ncbi:MAG TPA: hypothetical protein P5571_03405 [Candidatus Krumholzibacteria bacterium]|nr:hypothetical protein [Candidatus Krumholzibacteria bacterium]HRX50386.1 hypothetical protein [Candidatus Krumholzibacteria bacterium]
MTQHRFRAPIPIAVAAVLAALLPLPGCGERPLAPAAATEARLELPDAQADVLRRLSGPVGSARWRWSDAADPATGGPARLAWNAAGAAWRLRGRPGWALPDTLVLVPAAPDAWHEQRIPTRTTGTPQLLPLPRIPLRSAYYADLLHLLLELTRGLHEGVVRRWAHDPIPLAPGEPGDGPVDLTACLAVAAARWEAAWGAPLFGADAVFAEGIRLVHRDGEILHPPMWARLLRRDPAGRPLLITIVAGDNYDRPDLERYAVRGLAHELAHALQLWGHSRDRIHLLWESGPVVDGPSPDEVAALRLWRTLPEGLDLRLYGRSTELDPDR